jgi:hypothetical protein
VLCKVWPYGCKGRLVQVRSAMAPTIASRRLPRWLCSALVCSCHLETGGLGGVSDVDGCAATGLCGDHADYATECVARPRPTPLVVMLRIRTAGTIYCHDSIAGRLHVYKCRPLARGDRQSGQRCCSPCVATSERNGCRPPRWYDACSERGGGRLRRCCGPPTVAHQDLYLRSEHAALRLMYV